MNVGNFFTANAIKRERERERERERGRLNKLLQYGFNKLYSMANITQFYRDF